MTQFFGYGEVWALNENLQMISQKNKILCSSKD